MYSRLLCKVCLRLQNIRTHRDITGEMWLGVGWKYVGNPLTTIVPLSIK